MLEIGESNNVSKEDDGPRPVIRPFDDVVSPPAPISSPAAKVSDVSSLRAFAGVMGARYQDGAMSRDDAISLVTNVARIRQMDRQLGSEQVQAIVDEAFPADPADIKETMAVQSPAADPGPRRPSIISALELQRRTYAPPLFVVPRLIVEGVTLLAGKPKLGKSWLMLDLAASVASGAPVLGGVPTTSGSVLGLFLEDSERRLQKRLRALDSGDPSGWPNDLHLATSWPRLDQGGLSAIDNWCTKVRKPTLIVIDTLAKLRSAQSSRKSPYDLDYEAVSGLHAIAHKHQVAIVIVHHTRKADADDVFDTVSGTLGLTGAADSILVFTKNSGKAVLHARGRDIEDAEIALQFDPSCCRWIALGDAAEVLVSDERAHILAALYKAAGALSPAELMFATGIKNRNSIDILLLKMVREGQIEKPSRGKYLSRGKIGKKDPEPTASVETNAETPSSGNLSDLSAGSPPGAHADKKTTP